MKKLPLPGGIKNVPERAHFLFTSCIVVIKKYNSIIMIEKGILISK